MKNINIKNINEVLWQKFKIKIANNNLDNNEKQTISDEIMKLIESYIKDEK